MLKPLSEMTPEERAYVESWLSEQDDDGKEERPWAIASGQHDSNI